MVPSPIAGLAAVYRRRAEGIALVCGLLCFPLAWLAGNFGPPGEGPANVILPIIFCSVLASMAGGLMRRESDDAAWLEAAPRIAIRAGWIAALVGGGMTVLVATIHAFGIGTMSTTATRWTWLALILPNAHVAQVFLIAVLAFPPALFATVASALVTALVRSTIGLTWQGFGASFRLHKGTPLSLLALMLTVIGYLSPLTLFFVPKAKPETKPATALVKAPPLDFPKKLAWRYVKPADFETAEAHTITVASKADFGPIDEEQPLAISEDGRWLAGVQGGGASTLVIYDLDTLEKFSVTFPEKPTALTWSPDGKMLLVAVENPARRLWVFDAGPRRWMSLPKPVDGWLPEGRPRWWQPEEVLFAGAKTKTLDLANLRSFAPESSAKWKNLTEPLRDQALQPVRLPRTSRWQLRFEPEVQSYDVPVQTTSAWPMQNRLRLAWGHPQTGYRAFPVRFDLEIGVVLLAAADGSKLIRLHRQQGEIFYFGTRAPAPHSLRVTLPSRPAGELFGAKSEDQICAFVCGPMVNPLNGRTVGPDRTRIKALVRLASWQGTSAEFKVEEDYSLIQPGDVLADLHRLEQRQPRAVGDFAAQEWFTVLEQLSVDAGTPGLPNVKTLDREWDTLLADRADATQLISLKPKPAASESPPRPPPQPSTTTVTPPPTPPASAPIDEPAARVAISGLISQRVQAATRSDVNALIADYASRVEYMNHGTVGVEFIRNDIADYHANGARINEVLRGSATIKFTPNGEASATYQFNFSRQGSDGKWITGLAETSLRLRKFGNRWKIVEQHIKIRDKKEGG